MRNRVEVSERMRVWRLRRDKLLQSKVAGLMKEPQLHRDSARKNPASVDIPWILRPYFIELLDAAEGRFDRGKD